MALLTETSGERLLVAGLVYLEVHLRGAEFPPLGQERHVDALPVSLGGAINTASVARALGTPVRLCRPAGAGVSDAAISAALANLGIEERKVPARDDPAVTLIDARAGDRAFLSAADRAALAGIDDLSGFPFVHCSGLAESLLLARPLARARAAGAHVSVGASWDEEALSALAEGRVGPVDLLLLNEEEAKVIHLDRARAFERLSRTARRVVITLGARGAEALFDGVRHQVPAVPALSVDPTGTGDAFAGGLLAGLAQHKSVPDALALGALAASRVLAQIGGVLA